jgi:hypothetical protein
MNTILKKGRYFDYVKRVLASFAEIYNYDYVLEASLEESSKIFWEGRDENKHFYCYQMSHVKDSLALSSMAAMAIRIIEALGVHQYEIVFSSKISNLEDLFRYLDCLDINYEETLNAKMNHLFEIFVIDENFKKHKVLWGDNQNKNSFVLQGFYEDCVMCCEDSMKLEEKMLDVIVLWENDLELEHALYLTQELRLNGFKTEMLGEKDFDVIKEKYQTKYVIPIKEEDISQDVVSLVDLYTEETQQIKEMDLIHHLDINF